MFRKAALIAAALLLTFDWGNIPPLYDHSTAAQGVPCQDFFTNSGTQAGNVALNVQATGKANQFFYPTLFEAHVIANAAVTGAAGPAGIITTSGLAINLAWLVTNESLSIGQTKQVMTINIPYGTLRTSAPNTNFLLQYNGSGQATYNIRVNLAGCYGP